MLGEYYHMTIASNSLIEMTTNMLVSGNVNLTVWQYEATNVPIGVTPVQIAEAYWNHMKGTLRALWTTTYGSIFKTIRIRELNNPVGDYAEYDIPIAEQTGTRTPPASYEQLPPFTAVGVRLVVGTRATRPGQKRYSCVVEQDNNVGVLGAPLIALVQAHMAVACTFAVLGAPALSTRIVPQVMRKDATGNVTAHQDVTGYLINQNITSQNTRKYGRGV